MDKLREQMERSAADVEKYEIRDCLGRIQHSFKELRGGSGDRWLRLEKDETLLYHVKCQVRNCYQQLANLEEDVKQRMWFLRQNATKAEVEEMKTWEEVQIQR